MRPKRRKKTQKMADWMPRRKCFSIFTCRQQLYCTTYYMWFRSHLYTDRETHLTGKKEGKNPNSFQTSSLSFTKSLRTQIPPLSSKLLSCWQMGCFSVSIYWECSCALWQNFTPCDFLTFWVNAHEHSHCVRTYKGKFACETSFSSLCSDLEVRGFFLPE